MNCHRFSAREYTGIVRNVLCELHRARCTIGRPSAVTAPEETTRCQPSAVFDENGASPAILKIRIHT